MDVDPELFNEMTAAGDKKIIIIPHDELARLNVINNWSEKDVGPSKVLSSGFT